MTLGYPFEEDEGSTATLGKGGTAMENDDTLEKTPGDETLGVKNVQPYVCDVCRRSFTSAQGLGRHKGAAHSRKRRKKIAPEQPTLDESRLIRAVFPAGVPPTADAVTRLAEWLAEARDLAKLG